MNNLTNLIFHVQRIDGFAYERPGMPKLYRHEILVSDKDLKWTGQKVALFAENTKDLLFQIADLAVDNSGGYVFKVEDDHAVDSTAFLCGIDAGGEVVAFEQQAVEEGRPWDATESTGLYFKGLRHGIEISFVKAGGR